MLANAFNRAKSRCKIQQLPLTACAESSWSVTPDLILFEFEDDQQQTRGKLTLIERRRAQPEVPVLLITNPYTQDLLENDAVFEAESLSFSPFSLPALAYHTKSETRHNFLSRLRRLYEYGTITVRLPQAVLFRENKRYRATA